MLSLATSRKYVRREELWGGEGEGWGCVGGGGWVGGGGGVGDGRGGGCKMLYVRTQRIETALGKKAEILLSNTNCSYCYPYITVQLFVFYINVIKMRNGKCYQYREPTTSCNV